MSTIDGPQESDGSVNWTTTVRNPFLERNFRLGEWLPDPVTPLFATWYLPRHDEGFAAYQRKEYGGGMKAPFHAIVNGWYYGGIGTPNPGLLLAFARHPVFTMMWMRAFSQVGRETATGERWMGKPGVESFHRDVRPDYVAAIEHATAVLHGSPDAGQLVAAVDDVATASGAMMHCISNGAGFAWKAEAALRTFCNHHLVEPPVDVDALLTGLVVPAPPAAHAVTTLDWSQATSGERNIAHKPVDLDLHAALVTRREQAEAACRDRLAARPKLFARFTTLLGSAQRYVPIREEIVGDLTLGWPIMRSALLRLGTLLTDARCITEPDQIFWLTHDEIGRFLAGTLPDASAEVVARERTWHGQCLLDPPGHIGRPDKHVARMRGLFESGPASSRPLVEGIAASSGSAVGTVRVVTSLDQFDEVEPGDVLVARGTTPAWTPLFGIVAAVVTDFGSPVAHASMIAREYGIPAVVGTRHGSRVLRTGQRVCVDGTRGTVVLADDRDC